MKNNIGFLILYIGFIGITGLIFMLWMTPYGAGVSPDSIIYIGAVNSMLSGKGFSYNGNPITHYPPLYPLFLTATSLFENNLVQSARFLNAILFGINMGLFALAVYLTAGRKLFTTTCAALFFVSSAPIFVLHSNAWSEPLFITLSLSCIILLSLYVIKPTLNLLIFSSLSLGFAIVSRYIGFAFLPAAMFMIFIGGYDRQLDRRFRDAIFWIVLACMPLLLLITRNIFIAGSATNRSFVFHKVSFYLFFNYLFHNAFNFIAPISIPVMVMVAIFVLLAVFFIVQLTIFFKRPLRDINFRSMGIVMPVSCLFFSVSYLMFLIISISFFDAATPVDMRLLSPIFLIFTVGVFSAMWTVSQTLKKPMVWWCFILFVALSISIKIPDAIRSAVDIHKKGMGFTSQQWRDSESIAFVKLLTEDVMIYSNGVYSHGADALTFLSGKKSISIPFKFSNFTKQVNPKYNEEIEAMCNDIKESRALLVYFYRLERGYLPNKEELESTCQLPVLRRLADGTVYGEKHK